VTCVVRGKELAGTSAEGLTGVLVQPMVADGTEVIIGVAREPVSGQWWCPGPAMSQQKW
jgi:hypothetical protein